MYASTRTSHFLFGTPTHNHVMLRRSMSSTPFRCTSSEIQSLQASKNEIKRIILDFFDKCNAPVKVVDYDEELYVATSEMIKQLGYPLDDPITMKSFNPYLKSGVLAAVSAYPHLTNLSTRTFAAAYAAFFIIIDDIFTDEPGPISEFNSRLVRGAEQGHPVLDAYARLLLELPKYWDPVMADMMRQSAMTFMTSFIVEQHLQDAKVSFPL